MLGCERYAVQDEIERLVRDALPSGVGVGVMRMGDGALPPLHPLEEQYLGPNATARRRGMFTLGRAAARAALAELGVGFLEAIGRGPGGEPMWPDGVVGAISHSGELAMALVGSGADFAGIGVDLERRSPGLSERGARLVCRPTEMEWVSSGDDGALRRTLLFSAKEAIFKAVYPIERVWLGFGDAELRWDGSRCLFEARILKDAGAEIPVGTELEVGCGVTATEIVSTTFVSRRGLPGSGIVGGK